MSSRQTLETLQRFREDLEEHAASCLKIKDKEGAVVPLHLNSAQKHVHKRLQQQIQDTGRVRALVLKGRQQGISTYIAARFYNRASLHKGVNVYILSHEQSASDNLFDIVDRFHRHNPLAPNTGISNVKELEFDKLDSRYMVATAGQKEGGRSRTNKLFHGSESAFWNNAPGHFASSVQTVPDLPGTEIILESTANGPGGEFYERWQEAMAGRSDYIAVFVPWYWQDEYRRQVPEDFVLSTEPADDGVSEAEYARMFELDDEQMAWRRSKIGELRSARLFNQEYPATPEMAFTESGEDMFIEAATVLRARKREGIEPGGPRIMGVDPAGPGGDRFSVAMRQGYDAPWIIWRDKVDTGEATAWLRSLIDEHRPDRVFIDAGGIGHAVISHLRNEGPKYHELVRAVNFGSPSQAKKAQPRMPGPKNRRAEMWQRLKDWLELEEGVSLPDMDVLQADLTAPRIKATVSNDLLLESKEEMRKRGVRSPDLADSLALTFASNQHIEDKTQPKRVDSKNPVKYDPAGVEQPGGGNSWMAY